MNHDINSSYVVWLTGLSGSGKTTLAGQLQQRLKHLGYASLVLDGDTLRRGLCSDLGFCKISRQENVRRVGEVAKLLIHENIIVIVALISPFQADRDFARSLIPSNRFVEVYCNAALETCERREVKGLYQKARAGSLPNFTGIDSPYEVPLNPEVILNTATDTVDGCVDQLMMVLFPPETKQMRVAK